MDSSGNMNISTEHSDQSDICGIGCAIGISFGVLLLIIIIIFASYICIHGIQDSAVHTPSDEDCSITDHSSIASEFGLDEDTLARYPKLLYPEAKLQHKVNHSLDLCCSICLGDYKDSDVLRLLPDCLHSFHLKCVDFWLSINTTRPICRNLHLRTLSTLKWHPWLQVDFDLRD